MCYELLLGTNIVVFTIVCVFTNHSRCFFCGRVVAVGLNLVGNGNANRVFSWHRAISQEKIPLPQGCLCKKIPPPIGKPALTGENCFAQHDKLLQVCFRKLPGRVKKPTSTTVNRLTQKMGVKNTPKQVFPLYNEAIQRLGMVFLPHHCVLLLCNDILLPQRRVLMSHKYMLPVQRKVLAFPGKDIERLRGLFVKRNQVFQRRRKDFKTLKRVFLRHIWIFCGII